MALQFRNEMDDSTLSIYLLPVGVCDSFTFVCSLKLGVVGFDRIMLHVFEAVSAMVYSQYKCNLKVYRVRIANAKRSTQGEFYLSRILSCQLQVHAER